MNEDRNRDRGSGAAGGGAGTPGGVNAAELQHREKDDLSGTGGSSGGGTRAGAGDVSGGTTDRDEDPAVSQSGDAGDAMGRGKLAASESGGRPSTSIGDALGDPGRPTPGSGTKDRGELGGGGAMGGGGAGVKGTGSPGGDSRR